MHVWVHVEENLEHKIFIVSFLVNMCRDYTTRVLRHLVLELYVHRQRTQVAGFRMSVPALLLQATSVMSMSLYSSWVYSMLFRSHLSPTAHSASSVHTKNLFYPRDNTAGKCYPTRQ